MNLNFDEMRQDPLLTSIVAAEKIVNSLHYAAVSVGVDINLNSDAGCQYPLNMDLTSTVAVASADVSMNLNSDAIYQYLLNMDLTLTVAAGKMLDFLHFAVSSVAGYIYLIVDAMHGEDQGHLNGVRVY